MDLYAFNFTCKETNRPDCKCIQLSIIPKGFCACIRLLDSKQIECLIHALTSSILIECPAVHTLRILEANVLRSSTPGCPIVSQGSADCLHSNVTSIARSQCLAGTSRNCSIAFTSPSSSSSGGCDDRSFPGDYYVAVTYRCQPEFSRYLNGSAWAISLCEKDIRYGSLISINSDVSGLLGNFIYNSSCTMSLLLPRNTQTIFRASFFYKRPQPPNPCFQHIEIEEEGLEDSSSANVISVCGSEDPAFSVPCSTDDRSFRVKYVTNNSSVGAIFVLQVQANYEVLMRIQGGNPPSPVLDNEEATTSTTSNMSAERHSITGPEGHGSSTLISPTLTSILPSSGQSITGSQLIGIIVGCLVAAVILMFVIIVTVYSRRRKETKSKKRSRLSQNDGFPVGQPSTSTMKEEAPKVYGVKGGANNFAYVAECYVDGTQTSRLVVPTKQTIKTVFDV